jgi:capping protein beta
MFEQYRKMFFQGDVSSVYFWDFGNVFGGVVLIKKFYGGNSTSEGCWDSIHFVVVEETQNGRSAHYKFTSTVMLWLQTDKTMSGMMNLARKLTQQLESHHQIIEFSQHIINIGIIVQQMENKIHQILNSSDSEETKDILNSFYNSKETQDRIVLEQTNFTGKL